MEMRLQKNIRLQVTLGLVGLCGLSMAALGACGDGGGDGAQPASSSVAGSKQLLELTTEEAVKICKFAEQVYKGSLGSEDQYCTASALDGAESATQCQGYRDQCKDEGDYQNDKTEDWECETAKVDDLVDSDAGDCSGTVAEAEACLKADAKHAQDFASQSSCDDADGSDVDETTPECDALLAKCPGFDL